MNRHDKRFRLGPSILDEPISKSRDLYFSYFSPVSAISNAIGYAKFSRSHDAVIRVYDESWQRD
jgi:hypothetical protein